jgi:DNA-binding CsgD family transcriptional regulator
MNAANRTDIYVGKRIQAGQELTDHGVAGPHRNGSSALSSRPGGPRRPAHRVTARQRQVLDLIAEGLTTKEMSHLLGISDRGVAAQVSRLLVKFAVPNRASLVAAVLAEPMTQDEPPRPLWRSTDLSTAVAVLGTELSALQTAPLPVALTLGRDHLIAFMNEAAERTTGVSIATVIGTSLRDQLYGADGPQWAAMINGSFSTGAAASIRGLPLRWKRDDGAWDTKPFTCIAQPLRGTDGAVHGMLFVCTDGAA